MILFFDTETVGLPEDYNAPVTDLKNWPRMIQLAYILQDNEGHTVVQEDKIIKPIGFRIPTQATLINGISHEIAERDGEELKVVLENFCLILEKANYIVGHNVDFDLNIIGAEFLRSNLKNDILSKKKICTMKSSTDFCAIYGPYGYKWPKLDDLHRKLFQVSFNGSHNAAKDVDATMKCFWELSKKGVISLNSTGEIFLQDQFKEKSPPKPKVNSEVSNALWGKILEFCEQNNIKEISIAHKAYSIIHFEQKCKQIDSKYSIYEELEFLKKFWSKSETFGYNADLNKYQKDFITSIKEEIIEEHKDSTIFNSPNIKSLNDKVSKLETLSLFLDLENNKAKELVIMLYHYHIARYKEFLPLEWQPSKFINMQENNFHNYSESAKQNHQKLEELINTFNSTMDEKNAASTPDSIYDYVQKSKTELEKLKFEVGPTDNFYNNNASKVVVFYTNLLYNFITNMPKNTIHIRIDGMDHGKTLFDICLYTINEIDKIEVDDKTKNWFNKKKEIFIAEKHLTQPKTGCYIATMAYGDYDHPQVKILRKYRDDQLLPFKAGKYLVKIYYWFSPKLVRLLKDNYFFKKISKKVLDKFINHFISR